MRTIIESAIGPHRKHCAGYLGQGTYITAVTMAVASFPRTFTHPGSDVLDSVLAFDRAEASDAYLGQINMTTVSSFCGPEGLIWGYDCARSEIDVEVAMPDCSPRRARPKVRHARGLRDAARILFGTVGSPHFPFFPGSHVLCAGRHRVFWGPARVYAAIAIGIPKNRLECACLFMEDVGEIAGEDASTEVSQGDRGIIANVAQSVACVAEGQGIEYVEILADCIVKEVPEGHLGCALVAVPYFRLAQDAYDEHLLDETLDDWVRQKQTLFLEGS